MTDHVPQTRWTALSDALQAQGGSVLDEHCAPRGLPALPDAGAGPVPATETCGCGGHTLMVVPYLDDKEKQAIVCAFDDMAYKFPRFT